MKSFGELPKPLHLLVESALYIYENIIKIEIFSLSVLVNAVNL